MRAPFLAVAMTALIAGCASFSPDGGHDEVSALTRDRAGQDLPALRTAADAAAAAQRTSELLAEPLTVDGAVELALLNHPGLRASLARIGVAEADRVEAGRVRNPMVSFGRLSAGGLVEIDRAVMFDVLGLLTMPLASRVGQARFDEAKLAAASHAVELATRTRRAWYQAVAAAERAGYQGQVKEAADVASELARRMVVAGNFSALEQLREQAFHAEATAALARARQHAVATREQLLSLLGIDPSDPALAPLQLPPRLPELPAAALEPQRAEQSALDRRLDVIRARQATEATARSLGLTRATGVVNALGLGYRNQSETGSPRSDGYEVEFLLPIFDFGDVRNRRAEALYRESVHRAGEVAMQARAEVRERYSGYRTAWDVARHYRDEIVPLRKRIAGENLLRYNGMLIGVFDLLADARDQIGSATGYIDALRDFWLVSADLEYALAGRIDPR